MKYKEKVGEITFFVTEIKDLYHKWYRLGRGVELIRNLKKIGHCVISIRSGKSPSQSFIRYMEPLTRVLSKDIFLLSVNDGHEGYEFPFASEEELENELRKLPDVRAPKITKEKIVERLCAAIKWLETSRQSARPTLQSYDLELKRSQGIQNFDDSIYGTGYRFQDKEVEKVGKFFSEGGIYDKEIFEIIDRKSKESRLKFEPIEKIFFLSNNPSFEPSMVEKAQSLLVVENVHNS